MHHYILKEVFDEPLTVGIYKSRFEICGYVRYEEAVGFFQQINAKIQLNKYWQLPESSEFLKTELDVDKIFFCSKLLGLGITCNSTESSKNVKVYRVLH